MIIWQDGMRSLSQQYLPDNTKPATII
jgi:hypothetical protein